MVRVTTEDDVREGPHAPVILRWTPEDLEFARRVGAFRYEEKIETGSYAASDKDRDMDDREARLLEGTEGALAELLVNRWFGPEHEADWQANRAMVPGGALLVPCDAGRRVSIRQTTSTGWGAHLIRHRREAADDKVCILVALRTTDMSTARVDRFPTDSARVMGWAYAREIDAWDPGKSQGGKIDRPAWVRMAKFLRDPLSIPKDAIGCSPPSPSSCSGATPVTSRGVYESGPSDTYESELLQASASRGAPQN